MFGINIRKFTESTLIDPSTRFDREKEWSKKQSEVRVLIKPNDSRTFKVIHQKDSVPGSPTRP